MATHARVISSNAENINVRSRRIFYAARIPLPEAREGRVDTTITNALLGLVAGILIGWMYRTPPRPREREKRRNRGTDKGREG